MTPEDRLIAHRMSTQTDTVYSLSAHYDDLRLHARLDWDANAIVDRSIAHQVSAEIRSVFNDDGERSGEWYLVY